MDIKLNTDHLDVDLKKNHVNITMRANCSGGGTGTTDHSKLTNLDYEHSGHTGFASAAQIQELLDLLNNKQDTLIAGDNISIVDNIISATGLTKDEIYIGPDEPTDPNIKIWIDTNEVAQEFYTKEEIDAKNFATETWVSAQGYLTQHQDLSEYAKKTDIPSLEGYATEQWVEDKGYLTEHQDISGLATKQEVEAVEGKIPDVSGLAKKTELPTEYVKSASVQGNKLTLTNKDNTTVDFEPSGGGSSLPVYPDNNGNYNLSAQVKDNVVTLVWVPAGTSGVWQLPNQQANNLNLFQCVTINQIKNGLEVY